MFAPYAAILRALAYPRNATSRASDAAAVTLTRAIEGINDVDNAMTLKRGTASVGNTVDDGIVTAKVKSALFADASVRSFDVAVVTHKGEVQLSGYVDNQAQIDRAVDVARAVEGVGSVNNEMSIKK